MCRLSWNLGTSTSSNPVGLSRPVMGLLYLKGTSVAQWLRCCATNRVVAGSIPDGVIGIFHWHNPSNRTMALGSTQPLTEMSTRKICWGKCGRCLRLKSLPPLCAVVMKSGNLNFLEPSGPLQACDGTALRFIWSMCSHLLLYNLRNNEPFIVSAF
jgi:hypothetical protein